MDPNGKIWLLISLTTTLFLITHADVAACTPRERDALLAFKKGITSDPANLLDSWQEDQEYCCRWRGVSCSNRTAGHVVKLRLRNIEGDVYRGFQPLGMVGQISPSLLSLEHLEHLDLSMNSLEGPTGRLPGFLGSMKSLKYLNLSGIPFSGRVPPQLGNLSNLQFLDLSRYFGSQDSDSTDISWLTRLPLLQYLGLNSIKLNTGVDGPHIVNMIPSLRILHLSYCSLTSAKQSLPHLNLTKLEELDLSMNNFDHPVASCWFWNLTSLKYLRLVNTGLSGQFPSTLGDMTSLQVLDFSSNDNMAMMTTNLRNLCNLRILNLGYSLMYGNITEIFEGLPQCSSTKLEELDLSYNHLTGILPTKIGNFTSLKILLLQSNNLNGYVPSEISMLTNLTWLDLSDNNLTGVITEEHFANLSRLKRLSLSNNYFLKIVVDSEWLPPFRLEEAYFTSCQMDPLFPAWLQGQVDIFWLYMSNTSIIDKLPDWFCTTFSKTVYLDISNNNISGTLPVCMEIMSLQYLLFSSNELTGQIPLLPKNITILDLSINSLSGNLLLNFRVPNLISLQLFSNYITGHLPESICELQSLFHLDLGNNLFEGELPRCHRMRGMEFLLLSNNTFSGKFPSFLQSFKELHLLDLAHNRFSGRLPMWIGDLVELRFLQLSHNMFSGNIPISITNLVHLHHLNLAGNDISGVIPWRLSNLTGMTKKYVHNHSVDSDIPEEPPGFIEELMEFKAFPRVVMKGQERNYGFRSVELHSIDLSFNHLVGGIPEEITSLDALMNLNLSGNYLMGEIPDKIGIMQSLESLDLSMNKFFGEIPSSMSNLTFLSYLDLSYNNLTGRIPSESQLDTLYMENPSMYNGNNDLCGPPLKKKCYAPKQGYPRGNEQGSESMFFYFGLAVGFILALWVVFSVMLFKKTWRVVYFHLFDKLYDKIYVFVVVTWSKLVRKKTTN